MVPVLELVGGFVDLVVLWRDLFDGGADVERACGGGSRSG